MKDFSFSGIMANWLSFHENKSLHHNRYQMQPDTDRFAQFPDENFARGEA